MTLRRATSATIAVCCVVLAVAGTAARGAGPAPAKVTIESWPRGLFGYLSSPTPARCAARRWIVVYEQRGQQPDPATDRRIAMVRAAGKHGAYQWSIKTQRRGRFYAQALDMEGCPIASSKTIAMHVSSVSGNGGASYPPCSPYVSEGPTTICHFEQLHLSLDDTRQCAFGPSDGDCSGHAVAGLYPWGALGTGLGTGRHVQFEWHWGRKVLFVAYDPTLGNKGIAHLGGNVPGPKSPDFTVQDGFATNDSGYPNGDHFYTPDIPGQAAGEVGGPLQIKLIDSNSSHYAQVYIEGYVYLKQ